MAKGIGNFEDKNLDFLLATIEELISSKKNRQDIINKQIKYIDGKSPERILNSLKTLIAT